MTNPVTPNIGLNKIDRTSPSTTYFDLEKYIDQNADVVDQFAGETKQSLDSLASRLDTEERREVVLQPGLQVVHAERTAPFSLSGIKGRTLVNLLGRDGDFETSISTTQSSSAITMLDNTSFYTGSNSLKVTASGTGRVEHYVDIRGGYKVNQGRYYILMGMVRVNKGAAQMKVYSHLSQTDPNFFMSNSNIVSDKRDYFSLVRTAFSPVVDCDVIPRLYLLKDEGTPLYEQDGESSNFDSVRIFEVSQEEYDSFILLTDEEISIKYPYVNSTQSVSNPYVIRYGENLLPPFYEWRSSAGESQILEPYVIKLKGLESTRVSRSYTVKVLPNTLYTYSVLHDGFISVTAPSTDVLIDNTQEQSVTFNSGEYNEIIVNIYNNRRAGTFTFKDPMLVIGSDLKSFKPRADSMLAFQTELHANPDDGSDLDLLFEREGQYFKLAKWKKIVLDGTLDWLYGNGTNGYKWTNLRISDQVQDSAIVTKFTGRKLGRRIVENTSWAGPDYQMLRGDLLSITISNAESGWGDSYTPTSDEIKAYFLGWKMSVAGQPRSTPYNGTGAKSWVRITRMNDSTPLTNGIDYTSTIPTNFAGVDALGNMYTPYQLVYRLASPIVEPVVTEGCLTLNEGDNQVEVGTGIVLRERANPYIWSNTGLAYINSGNPGTTTWETTRLTYKVDTTMAVYKNDRLNTSNWTIFTGTDSAPAYGNQYLRSMPGAYDPSAVYSVTYLKLDKSPIQPISGTLASNEKAQIDDLTAGVAEALKRVSVVEESKKDKDSNPVFEWLYPTLLNGWILSSGGQFPAQYCKDDNGIVHLNGIVNGGSHESVIFILPPGYRPKTTHRISVVINSGTVYNLAFLNISPSGNITAFFPGSVMHLPLHCSFPAEQ